EPASGFDVCDPRVRCEPPPAAQSKYVVGRGQRSQAIFWGGWSLLAASLMVVVGFGWGWNAGSEATRMAQGSNVEVARPVSYAPTVATVSGGVDAQFEGGITL